MTPRRRAPPYAVLAAVLLPGACAPDGPGGEAGSVTLTVEREPAFTAGRPDGEGPDVFGRVRDVAFGGDGALLVLDDLAHRVVVFDTAGRVRAVLGRAGDGPGELRQPLAVASTSRGDVVVYDLGARAAHVFGPDGAFRARTPLGRPLGVDEASLHGLGADGLVFLGGESLFEEPDSLTLYRSGLEEGAEPAVVARVPNPQAVVQVGSVSRTGRGGFRMTRRLRASYGPAAHLAPLPEGRVAVAAATGYRVLVVGPDGAVEDVLSRPSRPRALTEDDRRLERERRREAMRRAFGSGAGSFAPASMSEEEIGAAVEGIIFPDALGPRGLAAWVRRDSLDVHTVEVARVVFPPG